MRGLDWFDFGLVDGFFQKFEQYSSVPRKKKKGGINQVLRHAQREIFRVPPTRKTKKGERESLRAGLGWGFNESSRFIGFS